MTLVLPPNPRPPPVSCLLLGALLLSRCPTLRAPKSRQLRTLKGVLRQGGDHHQEGDSDYHHRSSYDVDYRVEGVHGFPKPLPTAESPRPVRYRGGNGGLP